MKTSFVLATYRMSVIVLAVSLMGIVSCRVVPGSYVEEGPDDGDSIVDVIPPQELPYNPEHIFCSPFSNEEAGGLENGGLIANMYYLNPEQPRYGSALDYILNGNLLPADIYMNQLYVPTRPFDRGFSSLDGSLVVTENGDTLYEYFGLHLRSILRLTPSDEPGAYQLALLADDGAILSIQKNGEKYQLINNDGQHPTKMACAQEPIELDYNTRLPIELDYYQGPRYHISLVAMWRPFPQAGSPIQDVECGKSGNSRYFDSTQNPPAPTSTYQAMLERGWKVLKPGNFQLPSGDLNPCNVQAVAPQILDVTLGEVFKDGVSVSWSTDIPATSKVEVVLVGSSGGSFSTPIDLTLVTSHAVNLSGLEKNTVYDLRVISTSSSGGTSTSEYVRFRTQR